MILNLRSLPFYAALFFTLGLAACGSDDDKKPLEGDRISLFDLERSMTGTKDVAATVNGPDTGIDLPNVWRNEFWPQAGGYANHAMQHVALNSGELRKVWSSSIGAGSSKNLPLSVQPVMADGRVFTLDTKARVKAFDAASGKSLWTAKVMPETEDDPVLGGGLAFSGGRLFVTAGFNEVLALNPDSGDILWRAKVPGAVRGAPSSMPGKVFVVTVDNQTLALNAEDGKQEWTHQGLTETTGLLGAASPAANRDIVLPAYSSGEIYALDVNTGSTLWSDSVAPMTRSSGNFSDIRGLPVIDRGTVVAISYAGRIAAIDERTGNRNWDAKFGGSQTPFASGNRVFIVTSDSAVVSLDMMSGKTLWSTQLDKYKNPEDLEGAIVWYGPVLAGDRLLLVSSIGTAVDIDPKTGSVIRSWKTGQNVVAPPSIAGETLYLLSANGTLSAWK